MTVFKIVEPLWKIEPLFIVNCTGEEASAHLKKHFKVDQSFSDAIGSMCTYDCEPWRIVWVKNGYDVPVVCHEIFHLVSRVMQDKGVRIVSHDESGHIGDESAAYLLEFLMKQYLTKIGFPRGKKR